MTAIGFRRIALAMQEVVESAHHGHPDFRIGGRIFATLGYPDATCGTVMLTPEQQRELVREHPGGFIPVKGKWGEQGSTTVRLAAVDEEVVGEALTLARQNAAAKASTENRSTRRIPRKAARRGKS
jgi:hypothetical protein